MVFRKQSRRSSGVSATDPTAVFVIKSLLNPVVAVVVLALCLALRGESLQGPYFLIAVLGFAGAAELLGVAQVSGRGGWREALQQLADLTLRWVLFTACVWMLMDLSALGDRFDDEVLLSWALLTPLVAWASQWGAHHVLLRPAQPLRKAVIVGVTPLGVRLEGTLRDDRLLRIEVMGYFEDRAACRVPPLKPGRLLGDCSEVVDYVLRNDINVVYLTLPMSRDRAHRSRMLEGLHDSTASIYFVPDIFAFNLIQARFDILGGMPRGGGARDAVLRRRVARKAAQRRADRGRGARCARAGAGDRGARRAHRLRRARCFSGRSATASMAGKSLVYKFRSMTVTEDGDRSYTQVSRGRRASHARSAPSSARLRSTSCRSSSTCSKAA